ncbi:hypothetical protein V8E55_010616 [Tylopilus felleus]
MLLKVFWRLVRFFKHLLSFSPRFPRCNAALGRFVSLWRQVWRHKTPFFGLGSPPHILCSHDPAQPLLTNDQPAQELSTMNPPQPSDDHRGQLPTSNPHVVIQVSERKFLGPSGTLGTPAPICSSASSRVTTGSAEGESARSEPAWQVKPGVANGDTRYAPRKKDRECPDFSIPAGKDSLIQESPPEGWQRFVHPEGNIYFYYQSKDLRFFTDTYFEENNPWDNIVSSATDRIQKAKKESLWDDYAELVLNVSEDQRTCFYYFVNPIDRRLFWVDEVNVKDLFGNAFTGVNECSQIKYLLEEHYWYHCLYYPHSRPVPKKVFDELRGMLRYAKAELATSDTSLSPFTVEELTSLLQIVKSSSDCVEAPNEYSVCILARLMSAFAQNKFLNFHGQGIARLDADVHVFAEDHRENRSIFMIRNVFLLGTNVLLFGSLKEHARRLRRVWADDIIIKPRWKDFINRVTNELSRYAIFSTVMLTANLAFLAVPGIATPPQVIIYGSALTTITSIIISFVLLNVYSNPELVDPSKAAEIMLDIREKVGIPNLAITHSLPMALLIWSIFLFFTALAYHIFVQGVLAIRLIFGVVYLILLCLGVSSYVILRFFAKGDRDV